MKHINVKRTEGVDWTFTARVDSDKASATMKYTDAFATWISNVPKFGSAHPQLGMEMRMVGIKASRKEGGLIEVALDYESFSDQTEYPGRPPGFDPARRYYLDIGTSEEPLLTHPKIAELDEQSTKALRVYIESDMSDAAYDTATESIGADPLALFVRDMISKGVRAYVVPRPQWRETFLAKDLEGIGLDKVGQIDSPPGGAPSIGSRTWLLMGAKADQSADGESYAVEKVWQASDDNGWDTFLYEGSEE